MHSPEVCEDDDDDDSEDETSPIGEIDGLLLNLGNTIDGLYQLSFLIRNDRARRSAFRRAETYGKNIGSKGEDLLGYYDSHDRKRAVDFIRDLRSNAGNERDQDFSAEDKLLIDQLAQASSKRRRVFVYLEFHSEKLDTDQSLGQSADPTTQVPLSEPVGLAESRIVGSVTEATSFYPETAAAEAEDDIRSKIFSISTARAFDGTGVSLPKPPKVISGHKEFRCPYCRTWCPEQETKIGQWR